MNEVAKMALTKITEQLELTTRSGYQVKQNICSNNCYENTVRGLNVLVNSLKGGGELTEEKRTSLLEMLEAMLKEQHDKKREDNVAKDNLDKMLDHTRKANQWVLAIKSDNGK